MILTCNCGVKLKVGDDKITDAGIKIRCPKCGTTHTVRKPDQTVAVELPDVPAVPTRSAMPRAAPAATTTGTPLVIIAHDSKAVADMIHGVLTEAGMTTDYAPNGLEALKKATDLKPQAMIVDVGLTGIYGFELCERLKGDSDTRGIKIVLLSSVYGLTAYKRAPVTLYGADDYIEKHHISDQLVPKLKRLLSGETVPVPDSQRSSQETPTPETEEQKTAPPPAVEPVNLSVLQAQPVFGRGRAAEPEPGPVDSEVSPDREMPDIPSVLPTTPVTLGIARGSTAPKAAAPVSVTPPNVPPASLPVAREESIQPPAMQVEDASIKLDADFFEHEEYPTPEQAKPKVAADPEAIEKARRFARIIVSDVALYNQEAVREGIANDTFYDVLRDDIAEGRQLYDSRVPAGIRATKDYLQEAFDDFIASQKKLR